MRIIAVIAMLTARLGGVAAAATQAEVPLLHQAPTIDGRIDEEEWGQALRIEGLCARQDELDARQAVIWLACDGQELYLAMKSELPPSGILNRVKPDAHKDQPLVYRDDSLELWIDPHRDRNQGDRRYFQIIANAGGGLYDVAYDPDNKQQPAQTAWRVAWRFQSGIIDNVWHAEMAIPFESIGATAEDLKHAWGFRLVRNWKRPDQQADWAPRASRFEDRDSMALVHWTQTGPLVRMVSLRRPENHGVDLGIELLNRSGTSQNVTLSVDHQSAQNPRRALQELYSLGPGEKKVFRLEEQTLSGAVSTSILASSVSGSEVYFGRAFRWRIERPAKLWLDQEAEKRSLLDFAYYPYFNKVKARLDLTGLRAKGKLSSALLTLSPRHGQSTLAQALFPPLKDAQSELIMDVPPLPAGHYVLSAKMAGGEGVPGEPIVREFDREVFEWEHNDLGISDEVIPPFTPLQVKGKTLSAVLREHEFNDVGLWEQIRSLGVDVLAGPMRYEAEVGGQAYVAQATEALRILDARPAQVDAAAVWEAGPIRAVADQTIEMDGMMKVVLRLEQRSNAPVQKLDLVIPLRSEIATLMHAVTDGGQPYKYAGAIPAGSGLVWESSKASRSDMPGTLAPYLWLGNEAQGIAWFADSDRDWLLDDARSTQTVHRENGQVVLRVHLVTRPGPLGRRRTIIFGLQATPTKPRPSDPVPWRKWVFQPYPFTAEEGFFRLDILASCYRWGGYTPCGEVYPRGKDFQIYDLLRQTRQSGVVDREAVSQWLAGYKGVTQEQQRTYEAEIANAFAHFKARPQAAIPYTNARGASFNPEFLSFQDEWLINAYTSRQWPTDDRRAAIFYDCSPTRSYQDYSLWYIARMLDSGVVDGVYFDDVFLRADSDRVSGGAYLADDGTLRPSCDLFAMRDFLKRAQMLVYQKRKAWLNIAHMTNVQMVPLTTWVGTNLDWEWKYGMEDYQDRFSRDLARTETIGSQSGCVPLVLSGLRGQARPQRRAFVERTEVAVTLVHEIKTWQPISDVAAKVLRLFNEFGYGRDDCRVYRYWEHPVAARIEGLDAEVLVLVRGRRALIFAASFADGGTGQLVLSGEQLRLDKGGAFIDLETKHKLAPAGPFSARLELPRHDFRVVMYE